ncbi:MAG: DUF72 domain-containing protein [Candidatus Dormibacterales bacterium]
MTDDPHDPGFAAAAALAEPVLGAAKEPLRLSAGALARVGTASWTDPTMTRRGVFYPDRSTTAEERLRFYASQFPLVEVDATYYALPREENSRLWVARTPEHFVFDVKAHALMTGQPSEPARLPESIREALPDTLRTKPRVYGKDLPAEARDAVWDEFRAGIEPIRRAGRLGAVFLQFPSWVFPSDGARAAILEAKERLDTTRVAVEFRHGSWLNEKNAARTLDFLTRHEIPYVVVDEPQGFKSSVPPVSAVTSPELAVFRFHGHRQDTWERKNVPPNQRFRYLYDEDQLADWAVRIQEAGREAREVHALMNNCSGNYGTTNARQLADLLRQYQA